MHPDLEPRFLPPDHWQWEEFERVSGRRVRCGMVSAQAAKATLVILPGLNDFPEKYFETIQWALAQNYNVHIIDWFGQGGSGRYLDNPHKRHATDFSEDIADCQHWLDHIVCPAAKGAPLILIGHSMGGNLAMHVLSRNPDLFTRAAFIAPMFGIKALRHTPRFIINGAYKLMPQSYVPGGTDWNEMQHLPAKISFLTRDPIRNPVHNAWLTAEPRLQIGAITYSWIYHAYQSCKRLQKLNLSTIRTPCLIALAEHEILVDNPATRKLAKQIPHLKLIALKDSYHEPLMERDAVRDSLLNALHTHIEEGLQEDG